MQAPSETCQSTWPTEFHTWFEQVWDQSADPLVGWTFAWVNYPNLRAVGRRTRLPYVWIWGFFLFGNGCTVFFLWQVSFRMWKNIVLRCTTYRRSERTLPPFLKTIIGLSTGCTFWTDPQLKEWPFWANCGPLPKAVQSWSNKCIIMVQKFAVYSSRCPPECGWSLRRWRVWAWFDIWNMLAVLVCDGWSILLWNLQTLLKWTGARLCREEEWLKMQKSHHKGLHKKYSWKLLCPFSLEFFLGNCHTLRTTYFNDFPDSNNCGNPEFHRCPLAELWPLCASWETCVRGHVHGKIAMGEVLISWWFMLWWVAIWRKAATRISRPCPRCIS